MSFLIDGYNLLHAIGAMHGRLNPAGLERARRLLLDLLVKAYGEAAATVTVVFDARRAPRGAKEEVDYQGLHVRFAIHEAEADDLIEDLIRRSSAPRQCTVVSDDHRIQQAAQRRHCHVLTCNAYLDWLEQQHRPPSPRAPEVAAKPEEISPQETAHWLHEFADLADDPDLKELFEPFDFGEPDSD